MESPEPFLPVIGRHIMKKRIMKFVRREVRAPHKLHLKFFFGIAALVLASWACSFIPSANPATPTVPPWVTPSRPAPTPTLPTTTVSPAVIPPSGVEPTPVPIGPPVAGGLGPYALVLLGEGELLNVRKSPGEGGTVFAQVGPADEPIYTTGEEGLADDQRWVEILRADGLRGWVSARYLTEAVDPAAFCADTRVNDLLARLGQVLSSGDGPGLSALVSPAHGLAVTYFHTGTTLTYTPEQASWLFESTYAADWGTHPASGEQVRGSFHEEVLPKLREVFENEHTLTCNDPARGPNNYPFQWPPAYRSINFYAVFKPSSADAELDWRTWLVGIEYVDGKPYLFSFIHLFWEP